MFDYVSTIPFDSKTIEGVRFEVHKPSTQRTIEFNLLQAAFRDKARELQKKISANHRELEQHSREWHRRNEDAYRKAKLSLKDAQAAESETADAQRVVAGYEAEKEFSATRAELAKYDLSSIESDDDPRTPEVTALLTKLEALGETATLYVEPVDIVEERNWLRRQADLLMDEMYRPTRVRWGIAAITGFNINGKPVTVESQLKFGPPDLTAELFDTVEKVNNFSAEQLKKSSLPTTSNDPAVGSETPTTAISVSEANSTLPATAASISLS